MTIAADRKRLAAAGMPLLGQAFGGRNMNRTWLTKKDESGPPQQNQRGNPRLAGVEGLEPPTPGFGGRALPY